jgi:hypothetical protein
MSRRLAAFCLGAALGLTVAGSASAGRPGVWSTIVAGANAPTVSQELGIAQASNGQLQVAWTSGLTSVRAIPISAAGQLGTTSTIVSGWSLGADPTLLAESGGVRVFFGAVIPTQGLLTATASSASGPWTSPSVVENAEFAYGRTPGVTRGPDGNAIETWYSAADIVVHRGLAPGGTVTVGSGGTNTRPDIVTDASGAVFVAWCQFGGGSQGVLVRRIDPTTGAPVGSAVQLPGSATQTSSGTQAACVLESEVSRHEPIVARAGGGVFVAGTSGYPNLNRVNVWRLDSSGQVASTSGVAASAKPVSYSEPAIAAGPDGRIWVAWLEPAGAGKRIVAKRSNRAGTVFGAPVRRAAPAGFSVGTVDLSAQNDRVDVLAILGGTSGSTLQHTQLLPGLTLVRTKLVRRGRGRAAISFRVLDAGDAVAGARVRAGGRSAVTGAAGTATLVLRRSGVATATKSGYVGASTRFGCCR